ncbi:FAD dependent oxidoreductase [Suillus subalutaceus]|uniref:FAD dependent oxidoreductase n=1 Tax=Suillus subalutaceus TaxID=48586 RepID=UPI001B879F96|nr:FAD dependent oxidoreductase [Suillus subalutaceus]KAG1839891.1 FAD dependent oxidoreductase [Suillus subalutaceus]
MVAFADLSLSFLTGLSGLTTRDTSSGSLDFEAQFASRSQAAVSSSSVVYYAGESQYIKDNYHWSASSNQASECSFEPATAEDVGIALRILGETQTPFGVKSGGHATNAGFSSTPGVEIALYSFSDVLTLGMGLIWDDVYVALEPYNMTVVGPKITGIGIGGITLGGGYSYLTNQYGLGIDSVVAYELVMPNGTVAEITDATNSDLFFALRGGFNNFGIVTTVTVNTHPQSLVWGGLVSYSMNEWAAASSAIANYSATVTDPKASMYNAFNYIAGVPIMANILFYDGPTPPAGIFDEFLAIPAIVALVSTRRYVDLVQSLPLNATAGLRTVFSSVAMVDATVPVMDMIVNETTFWSKKLASSSAGIVTYGVDIFLPTIYDHVASPTAYPPSRSQGYSYIELFYGWTESKYDSTIFDAVSASGQNIIDSLVADGQDVANVAVYPNHAPPNTTLERIAVDPDNVMALTGGWKF